MIYEMIAEIKIPELSGFAEWSVAPGCGFRLVQGQPDSKNSLLRLGVYNLETELKRLKKEIGIEVDDLQIKTEQNMQTRWCTINDPWMNKIGLYEYLNEKLKSQVIFSIQDDWNAAGPA